MEQRVFYDTFDRLTEEGREVAIALGLNHLKIARHEHVKDRGSIFSGTDLPKMLSLIDEDYGTFRTVVAEKLGMIDREVGRDTTISMEIGSYMEPFLLSKVLVDQRDYLELEIAMRGAPLRITLNEFFRHETLPFGTSMDAVFWIGDTIALHCEFKTTRSFWDELPDKVIAQVQGQIMATNGLSNAVAVYSVEGGNLKFQRRTIFVDVEWKDKITSVLKEGERWLKEGKLPPLTYEPKTKAKGVITPRASQTKLAAELDLVVANKKHAEEREKRIKAIFQRHMQVGNSIKLPFGSLSHGSRKNGGTLSSASQSKLIQQIDGWIERVADEETMQEYREFKENATLALTSPVTESFNITYRPKAGSTEEE